LPDLHSLGRTQTLPTAVQPWLRTSDAVAPALLRFTLAGVMFPHGAQKMLGWFGGGGPSGTVRFFTDVLHLPAFVAVFAIALEFFGTLLLLAGAGTRIAALGFGALMIGAIATVHWPYGFFMNWGGAAGGEGAEYGLLVLGIVAALLVAGGGRWSVDRALTR
jgi:putative oxidoreductase